MVAISASVQPAIASRVTAVPRRSWNVRPTTPTRLHALAGQHFDFLAGLLFDETYGIKRAAIIPHAVVMERARFVKRPNSHKFLLRDDVWDDRDVRDVTTELTAAARSLE